MDVASYIKMFFVLPVFIELRYARIPTGSVMLR